MKLSELLKDITPVLIQGDNSIEISGISYDSRKVQKNFLFVCIKGDTVNGNDFIFDAINNGAIAIITDENFPPEINDITFIKVNDSKIALASISSLFYNDPSKEIGLVGVTGTNGKTTVIHYIGDVLEAYGNPTGLIGTLGYEFKNKQINIERINPTTPESLELQNLFRNFIDYGAKNVVMEVTSSALYKNRVDFCDFNVGVFTNLSQDHLEVHGTMENYKNEKLKLFHKCTLGVINLDDKFSKEIIEKATCKILTYGIDKDADIKASKIRYNNDSVTFIVTLKGISKEITINIPGKFTVYNALATIGACYGLGLEINEILNLVSTIKNVPGRLELINNSLNKNVIIDYAHTPDALEKLLMMSRQITKGKIIVVFGCGGDRDKSKRGIMGMAAGVLSDYTIITSDNPRTENPLDIIEDIEEGMNVIKANHEKIIDRKKAIERGLSLLKDDDLLVIAGKGHEDYQIIGNTKIHFDDREIVRELLG
ncbi:UDP-N-acetylmuramoyl-L-alanyl-D-glutamate--2,6-diaminopimelate ligase [Clostridium sp. 'White wine YQ']|uniref:UDP-N-acetylmuramoyl-L-alanyl-D-glutamate--2, 6-diaminopimelate ligase n=1 Tax=Clostridium sp. 'White wine YQ' TaxID=3027474 RepID=UPI0023661148|nr:UDP-N-acetylmuramoyl-L-alanyl-D-glutamate--2,6-diaminopimelate ligase [Clostridium sp. 'White wine YQ']MDD7795162.1 UDP-N-acetylmuramoyl-L-alanyl-D-glutamate--2,6-diaminopimelate ligase [Clostridium sp. 'White wine YQ']